MDLAGHRDPTVTVGYTRVTDQRLTEAVMGLDYGSASGPAPSSSQSRL